MEPVLLAVYGTLKEGRGNHPVLGNSELLGTHVTEPNYTMWSLGGFPAVSLNGNTPITTEIFKVTDEEVLRDVNRLEGFKGVKDDERNWYDTHTIETPYGNAEMYYFKTPPSHLRAVENGIW